jgi:protein TonB
VTAEDDEPSPVDSPKSEDVKPEPKRQHQERIATEPPLTAAQEIPLIEEEEQEKRETEKLRRSAPRAASDSTMRTAALGRDVQEYRSRLLAAIRGATFFPRRAVTENLYGETVVAFVVVRDGTINDERVVRSSGSPVLDEAALAILQKARKGFPSFPPSFLEDTLTFQVPIHFKSDRKGTTRRTSSTR